MIRNLLAKRFKCRKRISQAEEGAAAVEFALVVFPFLMLLGVILETGIMLFSEYTLQASVQQAARLMRTGQAQSSAMTAAQFKTQICKTASIIMNCDAGVTVYADSAAKFADLKAKLPSSTTIGINGGVPSASSFKCGAPLEAVGVVATYDWKFVFPFMNFNANTADTSKRRLIGIALFANEPFPASAACP